MDNGGMSEHDAGGDDVSVLKARLSPSLTQADARSTPGVSTTFTLNLVKSEP